MSMPGIGEPSAQVIVYGPDGTMYGSPAQARAAGVTNYTMQQPAPGGGMPAQPILPPQQQMPMPMQPLQMPSSMQMPSMNLQAPEFGIVDPTYMAQLAILNQGGGNFMPAAAPAAPMGLLGAGLESQDQFRANAPLLGGAPMIADRRAYSPNRSANADLNRAIAMSQGGGDGFGMEQSAFSQMSPAEQAAYYAENPTMAAITQAGQKAFSYTPFGLMQSALAPDFVADQYTISSGYDPTNTDPLSADSVATELSRAGYDDLGGYNDANTSTKIVCTAMNEAYGFGSFRNRIWLAYAAKNLTKAHEAGYHALFLPLVNAGYKQDKWFSKPLRAALENIARHRSADLRAEMRGGKRDRVGQAYRFILEPLCYAVGKLKGY